jgi:hypothetical protein
MIVNTMLKIALGEVTIGQARVFEWFCCFNKGGM